MKKRKKENRNSFINRRVFFGYNEILVKLAALLIVALYFVIRGSSWPLISNNNVIYKLFYTDPDGDHTLYNIAISYVAAYIFYLIQVYYPERKKTSIAIVQTKLDMRNCLHQCAIFINGWEAYTTRDQAKEAITGVNTQLLYFQDMEGHIVQMTRKCLADTVQRILEDYEKIKENMDFKNADMELQKLFLDMDFPEKANEWYQVMLSAEILCNNKNSTIMESYSEAELTEFKLRIMKLAMIYHIEECIPLEETKDAKKIMEYHQIIAAGYRMVDENREYFQKLPKDYNKPLRRE
ncbi:hypothetical protein [Ruminococcus sp. 2227st1_E6_2227SCRN_220401]|uniref:hypothetical protein n=1 Tax=unclassified Ruminococcus TaxID=2608920 RepID=UPI00319E890B